MYVVMIMYACSIWLVRLIYYVICCIVYYQVGIILVLAIFGIATIRCDDNFAGVSAVVIMNIYCKVNRVYRGEGRVGVGLWLKVRLQVRVWVRVWVGVGALVGEVLRNAIQQHCKRMKLAMEMHLLA